MDAMRLTEESINQWQDSHERYPEIWKVFHRLWGKAKENPGYDKSEWTDLYMRIERLVLQVK